MYSSEQRPGEYFFFMRLVMVNGFGNFNGIRFHDHVGMGGIQRTDNWLLRAELNTIKSHNIVEIYMHNSVSNTYRLISTLTSSIPQNFEFESNSIRFCVVLMRTTFPGYWALGA